MTQELNPFLSHCTFTGVDDRTDMLRLLDLENTYSSEVQFGVLYSYDRTGKDPKYLDGSRLSSLARYLDLEGRRETFALHLCGQAAWDFITKKNSRPRELSYHFGSIQLNLNFEKDGRAGNMAAEKMVDRLNAIAISQCYDIIIQDHPGNYLLCESLKEYGETLYLKVLFDRSGGNGVLPGTWPKAWTNEYVVCGYAGGLTPDNFTDQLPLIYEAAYDKENSKVAWECWTDMESGVRTDGWFDLDKVEKCLKIAEPYLL